MYIELARTKNIGKSHLRFEIPYSLTLILGQKGQTMEFE